MPKRASDISFVAWFCLCPLLLFLPPSACGLPYSQANIAKPGCVTCGPARAAMPRAAKPTCPLVRPQRTTALRLHTTASSPRKKPGPSLNVRATCCKPVVRQKCRRPAKSICINRSLNEGASKAVSTDVFGVPTPTCGRCWGWHPNLPYNVPKHLSRNHPTPPRGRGCTP